MDKLCIGIAAYGSQPPVWWSKLLTLAATLPKYDIQFMGCLTGYSMAADCNRNMVVKSFLETQADWLMWLDTDNLLPLGGIRRLMDTGKKLVSGLYYLKKEPYTPVAYYRNQDNLYNNIANWNRGEILDVDAAGMGCLLSHRSVFEDIQKQCVVLQRWDGGMFAMHRDDVVGQVPENLGSKNPKVVNGKLYMPVCKPKLESKAFPWFSLEYGRTEDMTFYELAARCGHRLWVDTSVEVPHLGTVEVTGEDFRTWKEQQERAAGALEVEMIQA